MAVAAAVFVGIVTDSVVFEAARVGIAAAVRAALLLAAAVALLITFYDAVTAALAGNGGDVAIVGEATRLDAITTKRRADVTDSAGREAGDARGGGRVHEETLLCIAGPRVQGTAFLGADDFRVVALIGGAVVNGTVRVARLVDDDLPFRARADDNVGASDGFSAVALGARIGLGTGGAGLSKPGEAYSGPRITRG